jgi:hypothetical protein
MVYTPTAITNTFTTTTAKSSEMNQNFTDCTTNFANIQTQFGKIIPIGGVLPWLKSLSGCPVLPSVFVECNGQTISDAASPFNGQTLPNLNASGGGNPSFLRGATASGGTGGGETHTHTDTLGMGSIEHGNFQSNTGTYVYIPSIDHNHAINGSLAAGNSLPTYYSVVWIMRIK